MPLEFVTVPLFGGAIEADLPVNFLDASLLRPVPDNQEVYIDKDGYTSVIVDITERVEGEEIGVSNDQDAMRYHYSDLIENADEEPGTGTWNYGTGTMVKMPTITACIMNATHDVANRGHDLATMFLLLLVRLIEQKTDLLITINVPYDKSEAGPIVLNQNGDLPSQFQEGDLIRRRIADTLLVKDFTLFAGDEVEMTEDSHEEPR